MKRPTLTMSLRTFYDCAHDWHDRCRRVYWLHDHPRDLTMEWCRCPCHARSYAAQVDRLEDAG